MLELKGKYQILKEYVRHVAYGFIVTCSGHVMQSRVVLQVSLVVLLVKNALVIEELPASPILKKDTRLTY